MQPNYIRYKEEKLKNGRTFGFDEWGIESEFANTLNVEQLVLKVQQVLQRKKDRIVMLCEEFQAKCSFLIVIKVEKDLFPEMGLSANFMKFAGEIGADVSFDIYYY